MTRGVHRRGIRTISGGEEEEMEEEEEEEEEVGMAGGRPLPAVEGGTEVEALRHRREVVGHHRSERWLGCMHLRASLQVVGTQGAMIGAAGMAAEGTGVAVLGAGIKGCMQFHCTGATHGENKSVSMKRHATSTAFPTEPPFPRSI